MEKEYQGTGEGVKDETEPPERLSEKQLQDLEWARDFMNRYEKKREISG